MCLRQNKEEFNQLEFRLNVPIQALREWFCDVGRYMFSGGGGRQNNWKELRGIKDAFWADEWRKPAKDGAWNDNVAADMFPVAAAHALERHIILIEGTFRNLSFIDGNFFQPGNVQDPAPLIL